MRLEEGGKYFGARRQIMAPESFCPHPRDSKLLRNNIKFEKKRLQDLDVT